MIPLTLAQVAEVVGGELADGRDGGCRVDHVTIDSRSARPGSLFVALPGEHADGHDYVAAATAAGASGFLCRADRDLRAPGAVAVDDPADALLGLGAWVRQTVDPTVVAITGSSGKTTTKDLAHPAIAAARRVVANAGSFNNELGVPLTCCSLEADTEVLVTELGARGFGHITAMAAVVVPDVAIVTAVGPGHLEMLGDLDGVRRAKQELVEALEPDGVAVLNADDPRVLAMAGAAPGRVVTYGRGADADLRATDVTLDERARPSFSVRDVRVRLPLPGLHNVGNALAALAAADVCGVRLDAAAAALATATVSRWRMELHDTADGVTLLNDAYNANPSSVEAALRTLAAMTVPGRRWAVLGLMAELGAGSAAAHERVGRLCAALALDGVIVVGRAAETIRRGAAAAGLGDDRVVVVSDVPAALAVLRERVAAGDAVLVKASRAVGLERLAVELAAAGRPGGPTVARGGAAWSSA